MRFRKAYWIGLVLKFAVLVSSGAAAQDGRTIVDVDQLSLEIAGRFGNSVERTQRLVNWVNTNLEWTATDYQERTAEQIIQRRGGNCAELSKVLVRLLKPTGIRYRWVKEINIHPYTPRRQETAEQMVKEKGNTYSVFGLRHNDHRWLEVYDNDNGHWVPADPSVGVVGVREWIAFRMGLADRPKPAVPAIAETVQDMIVPFAVIAPKSDLNPAEENRSQYYLVDEFNAAYGGELSSLPAWKDWVAGVQDLSTRAANAFRGAENLHESNHRIAKLGEVYAELQKEAKERGLKLLRVSK